MPPPNSHSSYILEPKKRPQQARSRATVEAIVQACEELLPERGYLGLTTNEIAERAGVNISSVYEYFHTKDAIVVAVIDHLVQRIVSAFHARLEEASSLPLREMVHFFIRFLYDEVKREEKLATVLVFTVPFFMNVPSVLGIHQIVSGIAKHAYEKHKPKDHSLSPESRFLMQSMTAGTILSLVLLPAPGVDDDAVLRALADRILRFRD